MKIAVVILNWNGVKLLQKFLPSVVSESAGADLYVIDNASTDDSTHWLTAHFPMVKIVRHCENKGFARGYNEGLQKIKADIFVLLNSDVLVTKNWLPPLVKSLKNNPQIVVVQPKIKAYNDREKFEHAGAAGGFLDALGYPYCRGRLFQAIEKDTGQYTTAENLHWASGACFVVRAEIFECLGGFDTDYFAYQEEIDLCWRIRNSDGKIAYTHESEIYHLGGGTLRNESTLKTFLNFRNSLYSLIKNLPTWQVPLKILTRLFLDGVAGVVFILQGQSKHTFAVVKAHFSFYKNMRKMWQKRNGQSQKKYRYKTKSIVWSHFIMGMKKIK